VRGKTAPKPKKVGAAAVCPAGKLSDRTAPYTVPMKAVPQQCGPPRTRPSSTFGCPPGCAWIVQPAFSCVHGAALRWCFAADVTGATATAGGHAGAWHARLRGATAPAATSARGEAGLPMPTVRGAGASASGAVIVIVIAVTVTVTPATAGARRT